MSQAFEDSPSNLLKANELLKGLTDAARDNPVPAALLGAGLVWVLSRDIAARVRAAGAVSSTTRARLGSAGNEIAPSGDFTGEKLSQGMRSARNSLAHLWEEQPLVVGAAGLAIGAGLAALFPATAVEAEILGPRAERLAATAKRLIAEKTG